MKSNEQIASLLQQHKYDGARYACLDRLTLSRIDPHAWLFLGQAMVGLKRGNMAKLCFQRSVLLDPFATWAQQAWGEAEAVGAGRGDKQVLKLLETPHVTVSACILTRDSSRTIRQCIEALQGAVDEIIVVDTGSKDATVQIVESLNVTVHHFQWTDDFAVARNYAQSLAVSDWVIAIDSDEILYERDKPTIRQIASIYSQYKNVPLVRTTIINTEGEIDFPAFVLRMYPLNLGVHWISPIHENPVTDGRAEVFTAAIRFKHDGYESALVGESKSKRNIAILRSATEADADNPIYHYFLGRELMFIHEYTESESHLRRAVELANFPDAHSELVNLLVWRTSRLEEARKECNCMMELYPDFPDVWGWLAVLDKSPEYGHKYIQEVQSYRGIFQINPQLWVRIQSMPELIRESTIRF